MLASCTTLSNPPRKQAPPVDAAKPADPCPPSLTADLVPEPDPAGDLIKAASDAERAQVQSFLDSDAEARAWGRQGWDRAKTAKETCDAIR